MTAQTDWTPEHTPGRGTRVPTQPWAPSTSRYYTELSIAICVAPWYPFPSNFEWVQVAAEAEERHYSLVNIIIIKIEWRTKSTDTKDPQHNTASHAEVWKRSQIEAPLLLKISSLKSRAPFQYLSLLRGTGVFFSPKGFRSSEPIAVVLRTWQFYLSISLFSTSDSRLNAQDRLQGVKATVAKAVL